MYTRCVKRLLDVVLSACLLVALSPVLLAVALFVRVKLGSPVIFKQVRPGRCAKLFTIYKFRTMTDERGLDGTLLPDERRLTAFGAALRSTSLDELPELWNILKGDMSFVGPRPQLVRDMVFFTPEQMRRQDVRPGLTGLAQVKGRNCITWHDKLSCDLAYVSHITFFEDATIFFKTVSLVFRREGVSAEGCATAQDYGDALLEKGEITKKEYEAKNSEASRMVEEHEMKARCDGLQGMPRDSFAGRALGFLCGWKMSTAFRIAYLLLVLASFNSLFAFTPGLSYGAYACAGWGGILIVARLLCWRRFVRFPRIWLLAVFLGGYALSAVLTAYPNVSESLQGITWLTLEFFLLYLWDAGDSFDDAKKGISAFAATLVVYVFVASVVSLCMAAIGFSCTDATDIMQQRNIGIVHGRLWGIYSDPNYGSILAVVSVLLSLLLLRRKRTPLRMGFVVLNGVVQIVYAALSGSRTGLLVLLVAFAATAVCLFCTQAKGLRPSTRLLAGCGLAVVVLGGSLALYQGSVAAYNAFHVAANTSAAEQSALDGSSSVREGSSGEDALPDEVGIAQREELAEDKSSGRLRIWGDAWRVFCDNPVFGVSYRSIGDYAQGMMPNSFIAHRGYTSMHNVFLDIMVGQGLVGLVPFVLVLVFGAKDCVYLIKRSRGEDAVIAVACSAVLGSILLSAFLYSEIVYINTAGSILFWTILGFMVFWRCKIRMTRPACDGLPPRSQS